MSFNRSVGALVELNQEFSVKRDGKMSRVSMHFPPGPQFLVDVRIGIRPQGSTGVLWVVPSEDDTFIADDDALKVFDTDAGVRPGDIVRVEWKNFDGGNAHQIPVDATIEPFAPVVGTPGPTRPGEPGRAPAPSPDRPVPDRSVGAIPVPEPIGDQGR